MDRMTPEDHFLEARNRGLKTRARNRAKGLPGTLVSLDGLLQEVEIVSEVFLGTVEIPLKNVVGTSTQGRAVSFAPDFMPLLDRGSEFSHKWIALCGSHLKVGIRDPIKVYEYLNRFYVLEGNKRVSVLKYFDAVSVTAAVTRLVPRKDPEDPENRLYYEFMEFHKKTGINNIWMSREGGFRRLLEHMDRYRPSSGNDADRYREIGNSVYYRFRRLYHKAGGARLSLTTGDAFLAYLDLYGMPVDVDPKLMGRRLRELLVELSAEDRREAMEIRTEPLPERPASGLASLVALVKPAKTLRIAFAYPGSLQSSAWTFAHDLGRRHVEDVFGDQVETSFLESVPEDGQAYGALKRLAEEKHDVLFATSPAFLTAALRVAMEHPDTAVFACAETVSYRHVTTYFGRMYEARFLSGVVAGSVTASDRIGYIGTFPTPEVLCSINAYALGAAMVNPRVRVSVRWLHQWDSREKSQKAGHDLIESGVDVITHHNVLSSREIAPEYGVYSMVCDVDAERYVPREYLAAPVWNWGIFYEKIIRNLLNGTFGALSELYGEGQRRINFWWGLDSGIVDFFYSRRLVPLHTQKLLELLKRDIGNQSFHPFTGPIRDQSGRLRLAEGEVAGHDQVLAMDWLVDLVEADGLAGAGQA